MTMDWKLSEVAPSAGSSNGIQQLRIEEDEDITAFATITAVDPGGSTGICTVWYWPEGLESGTVPLQHCLMGWEASCLRGSENEQAAQVMRWISDRSIEESDVVIEDFILRSAIKGRELLSPVRITAKLEYHLWRGFKDAAGGKRSMEAYKQSPNDAKGVVTDERLKLMTMYTPGPDHARDATRHAVLWLRKHRVDIMKKSK